MVKEEEEEEKTLQTMAPLSITLPKFCLRHENTVKNDQNLKTIKLNCAFRFHSNHQIM